MMVMIMMMVVVMMTMMMMTMMMVMMMMIKMNTIEENVQNKARCSPMWASRPVLPPARLWSNFAPLLLLLRL